MALPTSGPLSLDLIRYEFGGGYPINLSQYYRGGGLVPNTPANANVPTSGPISIANFYGASASSPLSVSVSPAVLSRQTNQSGQTALSGSFTISASGGTGSYSYNAVWLSGGTGLTLTQTNTANPTVSGAHSPITSITGVVRMTITSGSEQVIVDRNVTFSWGQI